MRLSYANWQLALLTVLLMSALTAELWLHSDLRLKQQIAGHRWSTNAKTTVRCPCQV